MKEPRRLIEQDELVATLVDDAQSREPDPRALQKLLDVLDSPAATASAPARARVRAPDPWIYLALVGAGALALLGYGALDRRSVETAPVVAAPSANAAPLATGITSPAPEAVPSLSIADLPDVKDDPSRGHPLPGRSPVARSSTSASRSAQAAMPSKGRELELITRAREALTKGDTRECLATIALHDAEFPDGQFTPEAAVMRIEATQVSGDRARARSLARAFLAKSPDSPYAARIRSLLASLEQE